MADITKYTQGGYFSEGLAFEDFGNHMRDAADIAGFIGHNRKENHHALSGDGLLKIQKMLLEVQMHALNMMQGKLN